MAEHTDLAEWFADMARELMAEGGLVETLNKTCTLAVATIDACQSAGILQLHRGQRIETPAASSSTAERLHSLQYELDDGPCMQSAWQEETVQVDDMAAEPRWPRFAAKAAELGIRSMLCFRLFKDADTLGALNLFSDIPHAFDEHDCEIGLIFASHAAVAMAGAQSVATLEHAVHTRQRIGEAVGILSERHNIRTAEAFHMLARVSQTRNIKLREVAERLVASENANRKPTGR